MTHRQSGDQVPGCQDQWGVIHQEDKVLLREMFVCPVGRVHAANLARLAEWGQSNDILTSNLRGVDYLTFGEVERRPELRSSTFLPADEKADQLDCDIDVQETILRF